jgi:hypothetical protein
MSDEETISLYLDLEPKQRADMEVVARAALAWAAVSITRRAHDQDSRRRRYAGAPDPARPDGWADA